MQKLLQRRRIWIHLKVRCSNDPLWVSNVGIKPPGTRGTEPAAVMEHANLRGPGYFH